MTYHDTRTIRKARLAYQQAANRHEQLEALKRLAEAKAEERREFAETICDLLFRWDRKTT